MRLTVTPEDGARLEESPEDRAERKQRALARLAAFSERMARQAAGGGVVVDVCPKHGTWFDAGELRAGRAFPI